MVRQFLKKGQVRRQDKGKEELARQLQEKKKNASQRLVCPRNRRGSQTGAKTSPKSPVLH